MSSNGTDNSSSNGFNSHNANNNPAGPDNYYDYNKEDSDEIDISHIFYMLWGHKWIIIGTVVVCVIGAWLIAHFQTPIYKSEGSLMVTSSRNQYSYAGSDLTSLLTNSYGIGVGNTVVDELQMLQSRRLSKLIADTLMQSPIMRNGRMYPVLFTDYPDDSTMADKEVIARRLRHNLSFEQASKESRMIDVAYQSPSPVEAATVVDYTISAYSRLSTQQNRESASAAVQFLKKEQGDIHGKLQTSELKLEHFRNNNKVVKLDVQTQTLINRLSELEQQRQQARTQLIAANSGIKQYREQINSIKPGLADQFAQAIGPTMERLQHALAEAKTNKTILLARNPKLKNSKNPPRKLREDNRKIADYENLIRKQTKKLFKNGGQYLGVLGGNTGSVTQNIAEMHNKLIALNVKQQQYQAQVGVLTDQINKLKAQFNNLPKNMINLARLQRKAQVNQTLYLTITKQLAKMSLWRQTQIGQGELVDKGNIPGAPIEPNKKLYLLVGFILGAIVSIGYVFTSETFNNRIDGTEKLKSFGTPMLAAVPDLKKQIEKEYKGRETVEVQGRQLSTRMVALLDAISPSAESFRRLESNIIHSNPDKKLQTLLITSTAKGEGKTTVASNLGVIMAESGQQILIIDTDLYRPNIHKMFGLDRSPGVNEVLFDELLFEEALHSTPVPNLSVLTAGSRPSNPSVLMKSVRFDDLIRRLKQRFDCIIFDSAPFGIISDISSFIDQIDGVAVVCKFNETKIGELQHALEQLQQVNANVIGTVLNRFKPDKSSDYYYGYHYYNYYNKMYDAYEEYEKE